MACELKLMFAHIVTTYDVKLEIEGVRPPDMLVMTTCVPNSSPKTSKHVEVFPIMLY